MYLMALYKVNVLSSNNRQKLNKCNKLNIYMSGKNVKVT